MDTPEKIQSELEAYLKNMRTTGIGSIDMQSIDKLDKISDAAAGLGMMQGSKLVNNLSAVLKNFKEGKTGEDSVDIRVTALDFYLKNTQGGAAEEL